MNRLTCGGPLRALTDAAQDACAMYFDAFPSLSLGKIRWPRGL